jgi:hypothetical protein
MIFSKICLKNSTCSNRKKFQKNHWTIPYNSTKEGFGMWGENRGVIFETENEL